MKLLSKLMTLYAAALLLFGTALLFVPEGFGAAVSPVDSATQAVFVQLLGAAFIGFAAANWITRRSPVGGVYGRAIVLGNLAFSLVGSLALIGSFPAEPGFGFWLLLAVFGSGAGLHGALLLWSGPRQER